MPSHGIKEIKQEKIILQELNEFLENSQLANQSILNSMSHDLRTPLVIIKSYVDMLLSDKFGKLDYKQKEKLKSVQENVDILTIKIHDILEKIGNQKND